MLTLIGGLGAASAALAIDVNEHQAVNGVLAGAYQCQQLGGAAGGDDACRGGLALQPELDYAPTEADELFVKLGLGVGNGLNTISPFELAPWAADLDADVRDINGRGRSYLLEAWYAHTVALGGAGTLRLTGGIIDPAFYVNENAYANGEFTQFSNEIFVNSRSTFLPAYDCGGALVWQLGDWTLTGVGMAVGDNDDGRAYTWYGAEVDYRLETRLGEGHYRVMYSGTSNDYPDPNGMQLKAREAVSLSFDQELGEGFGVFLRMAWQAEDAAVTYAADYSGGVDINGRLWGREGDNVGIGYGYLEGGNTGLEHTRAFETYYRLGVNDTLALTADVQWMQDVYHRYQAGPEGWIFGVRAVAEF